MQRSLGVFALLSAFIAVAWAYPTSVPPTPEVCKLMTPGHGPSPQKSTSPYVVQVSKNAVNGGNNVKVTLSGNGKAQFLGFYIQARDSNGDRVGTFDQNEGSVKTHNCFGIKNNAAHHAGKDPKESIDVNWKAPKSFEGDVTFVVTFVQEFERFWTNVRSSSVSVSVFAPQLTNQPFLTDSRKERTTPKATQESRILNYNPYTPFSPLRNEDFDTKDFSTAQLPNQIEPFFNETSHQVTAYSSVSPPSIMSTRKRKGRYIPRPTVSYQNDAVIIQNDDHQDFKDSTNKHHNLPFQNVGASLKLQSKQLEQNLPLNYNQIPYKSLLSPITPAPQAAGYYSLDNPKPYYQRLRHPYNPIPAHSRPLSGFRPNFFPTEASSYTSPRTSYQREYASYPQSRYPMPPTNSYVNPPTHKTPASSMYSNYYPRQRGVLVGDYVADAGIILPEGMQSYEIPRYGYLVFNPHRGPPFYLIPAPDASSFEEANFGDNFHNQPQPVARASHKPSSSGGVLFEPSYRIENKI